MATCDAYASIPRAQLTFDYLHTNSTTHEFLFGALAELVDNARDAASKKIDIYSVPADNYRGKYMLCFLDDGDGMDPDEVANVIKFGRSDKRIIDKNMIGQYGNGLKSGTMRIAKDMILFTKKENKMSCLFISRTFHEKEKIHDEIVAPLPSWDARTRKPLHKKGRDQSQHQVEVDIVTKYSPFKTTGDLFSQFDQIKSTGTLVILFNMALMDNGEAELDILSDPNDVVMADPYPGESYGDDNYVIPERKSFRAYTSILYLDPRMKIYIQRKKVHTVRLTTSLYKPVSYTFTSKRFKCRLEKEAKRSEMDLKTAEARAHELDIQDREEREKEEQTIAEQRQAGVRLAEARADVNIKEMILNNTKKALKDPQTLDFVFGINLNKRRCYGTMVYNCNRLIKMYEKVGCQVDGGVQGYGVMGVVNVPYLVLEPTHNKQDFADGKEFKALTKALGEHLDDYVRNCPIAKQGVKFWDSYGYNNSKWKADPSSDEKYIRKRMMDLPLYVQCDKCLKWRELAFHSKYVQNEPDDNWCCKMNPEADCNNCQRPEKKPATIVKAVLKKKRQDEDFNKSKKQKAVEVSRESRPQALESRQTSCREPVRRQTPPPPPQKAYKPVQRTSKPASQPRHAITTSTKPKSALNSPRPSANSTSTVTKPAKQESRSSPLQKQSVSRPRSAADSTEIKKLIKRPISDTDSTFEKENVKRRKSETTSKPSSPQGDDDNALSDNTEMDWLSEGEAVTSGSYDTAHSKPSDEYDIAALQGRACRGKTDDGDWHAGTIVCLKQKGRGVRAKVKFTQHQNDKYDKWFDCPGPNIRLNGSKASTPIPSPPEPESQPSPQPLPTSSSVELPSTTTEHAQTSPVRSPDNGVSSYAEREETVEDISTLSRKLLEFFVPPNFQMSKEQLGSLSVWELRNFKVGEFCDQYEEGLGTLMNDVTSKGKEAEQKVDELRKTEDNLLGRLSETSTQLRQKSEELTEKSRRLTSLQEKTARLISMLNDNPEENQISVDSVEETLDRFISLLEDNQNEGQ